MERFRRRDDEECRQHTDADIEREEECGICLEMNSKIVLPNCNHAMCLKCYREWYILFLSLYDNLLFVFGMLMTLCFFLLWVAYIFQCKLCHNKSISNRKKVSFLMIEWKLNDGEFLC